MKPLQLHYEQMYLAAKNEWRQNGVRVDPLIHSPADHRFGLTLLIRPSAAVLELIQQWQQSILNVEPNLYIYPSTDIHVTLLSVFSCEPGFQLQHIHQEEYVALVAQVLQHVPPFRISFSGITASPEAIMVCGYVQNDELNALRNNLRGAFRQSSLRHSIDKRYALTTAHITAVRFSEPLHQPESLIQMLDASVNHPFGDCWVDQIDLVYNDWYMRNNKVQLLHRFSLTH